MKTSSGAAWCTGRADAGRQEHPKSLRSGDTEANGGGAGWLSPRGGWRLASRPGSSPWPGSREKAAHPQLVRERRSLFQGFLGALKTQAMAAASQS